MPNLDIEELEKINCHRTYQINFVRVVKDYAFERHANVNQMYGTQPYSEHLLLTEIMALKFQHLVPVDFFHIVQSACFTHDIISDARQTYNDIVSAISQKWNTSYKVWVADAIAVAEISRAVTKDIRGRNRVERMPAYIYKEIRDTRGATFVKICDRLANVFNGIHTNFEKAKMYYGEHAHFKNELDSGLIYNDMWAYMEHLFNKKFNQRAVTVEPYGAHCSHIPKIL